jgi:hypothetical protein
VHRKRTGRAFATPFAVFPFTNTYPRSKQAAQFFMEPARQEGIEPTTPSGPFSGEVFDGKLATT